MILLSKMIDPMGSVLTQNDVYRDDDGGDYCNGCGKLDHLCNHENCDDQHAKVEFVASKG